MFYPPGFSTDIISCLTLIIIVPIRVDQRHIDGAVAAVLAQELAIKSSAVSAPNLATARTTNIAFSSPEQKSAFKDSEGASR
jgi:hypothetical protein